MTEPDVVLTDLALCLLGTGCSLSLIKFRSSARRFTWLWITLFGSLALASLTGAIVHGWFAQEATAGYRLLWPMTLIVIGITASAAWLLAGHIGLGGNRQPQVAIFAAVLLVAYVGTVLFLSQRFLIAICAYLPAMLAMIIASLWAYAKEPKAAFLQIAWGIVITFVASFVQQKGIALSHQYFNNNSTFHLIQGLGLVLIFMGSKALLSAPATQHPA